MKQELKYFLKKYKYKLIIELFVLIALVYLTTCPAKYLGKVIDLLYNIDTNKQEIIKNIIIMILSSVGIILLRIIFKRIDFNTEIKISAELKNHLFKKFMKVKLEEINAIKNGELMSYFVRDTKKVPRYILRFYSASIRVIVTLVTVMILMTSSSNIQLAICAVIPVIITMVALIFIRKKIRKNFNKAQEVFTNFSEFVQENTDSIRTVKAFAGEEKENEIFKIKNEELKSSNLKVAYVEGLLDVVINIGLGIAYTVAILWGANLVIEGKMTIGNLIAFMGYLALLDLPMQFVPWVVSRYDELKISIKRLDNIFNLQEEKVKLDNTKTEPIEGDIEIKDLTFHYPDSLEEVLSNININLKQGQTLGIIGVIGSGKTTLMNLLLKLYIVDKNKIKIGGKDINDIPTSVLRDNICYITQDNFLFSTSIKENINLFKDDYNDEEITQSTKESMIYTEVEEMEQGIYTIIGEKGIDLSGGQKQRVALSRAFLNNSKIVIFDDTFSALDNRTEQNVLKNIKKLVKDKTCIIVSNRVSDIKDCDKIIVLEKGKIIEEGKHKVLLENKGQYYKFYEGQANKVEELA